MAILAVCIFTVDHQIKPSVTCVFVLNSAMAKEQPNGVLGTPGRAHKGLKLIPSIPTPLIDVCDVEQLKALSPWLGHSDK
jgi:hypothetical protein